MIKTLQKRLAQIEAAIKLKGKNTAITVYECIPSVGVVLVRCMQSGAVLPMDELETKHPDGNICVLPAMPGEPEIMDEWEQGLSAQQAELKKRVAEPSTSD